MKIRQIIHASLMLSLSMMVSYPYCQVNDTIGTAGPTNNNGSIACSNELRIKEFSGSKTFKVVVSQTKSFPIDVFGLDFFLSPPYKWELGDFAMGSSGSFKWEIRPVNVLQGKTEIKIDAVNNTNMPKSNDYFGDKYGVVNLIDHNGNFTLSTEPYLNKKVQVFYEKDAPNPSNPDVPNWLYYWKQLFTLTNSNKINYDKKLPNDIWGYSNRNNHEIFIGNRASKDNDETKNNGIDCFYETLIHENHHLKLWDDWWPSGFDYSLSKEDEYPNSWEENDYSAREEYFFKPNIDDKYTYPKDIQHPTTGARSPGYNYEEDHCRNMEHTIFDYDIYNKKDWSFDYSNKYQGKQWNKK